MIRFPRAKTAWSAGTGRAVFAAFVSLLLAVQVTLAFHPAQARAGQEGWTTVICGPDGLRTVTVTADGAILAAESRAGETDAPDPGVAKCPFCVVHAAAPALGPVLPPRRAEAMVLPRPLPLAIRATALRGARAAGVRAPPSSV